MFAAFLARLQSILQPPPKYPGIGDVVTPSDWNVMWRWLNQLYLALNGATLAIRAFSTNLSWDSVGKPDTRPGTWGNADFFDFKIPFENVPNGQRVQIVNVYGTHQAWAAPTDGSAAALTPGTACGILWGMLVEGSGQSPYVGAGFGSEGCFEYKQDQLTVVDPSCTLAFSEDVALEQSILGADNILTLRMAQYLNTMGGNIHQEWTGVIEFQYIPAP